MDNLFIFCTIPVERARTTAQSAGSRTGRNCPRIAPQSEYAAGRFRRRPAAAIFTRRRRFGSPPCPSVKTARNTPPRESASHRICTYNTDCAALLKSTDGITQPFRTCRAGRLRRQPETARTYRPRSPPRGAVPCQSRVIMPFRPRGYNVGAADVFAGGICNCSARRAAVGRAAVSPARCGRSRQSQESTCIQSSGTAPRA